MEPHATVAMWEGENLTLWDKSQWVNNVRDAMARIFGIPAENVRVINPFVGGAFGSALRPWSHVALAAARRAAGEPSGAAGVKKTTAPAVRRLSPALRTARRARGG